MDKKNRCSWCTKHELDQEYHDQEWGVPVTEDKILFEFLILEGAQAGLSWSTILKKRQGYQKAFHGFAPQKVARITSTQLEKLKQNPDIVRNRLKIEATVINAQNFLKVQKEFGSFASYLWSFVDHQPIQNHRKSLKQIPAKTDVSDKLSKDLKKRGFKFIGTTICYAFMQAVGMVNDHVVDCFRYSAIQKLGKKKYG